MNSTTRAHLALAIVATIAICGCKKADRAPAAKERDAAGDKTRPTPAAAAIDAAEIERVIGAKPSVSADGVAKVTWARAEVPVTVDGMAFPPSAGLTSWAAFQEADGAAMVMGDTVVFEDEVSAAMDAAFAHGLAITALHNHFFFDNPKVYFMHIGGHGAATKLATGVRAMWDAVKAVRKAKPTPAKQFTGGVPKAGAIDATKIGAIIGVKAASKPGGVVKVSIGREATMHETKFAGSMGLTTWAAFTGSDAMAAIDGDFAMTAAEVQPVLRALRAANIHVVALHNHMIGESPAYYFTHFWGKGSAEELARGFRATLDAQGAVSK